MSTKLKIITGLITVLLCIVFIFCVSAGSTNKTDTDAVTALSVLSESEPTAATYEVVEAEKTVSHDASPWPYPITQEEIDLIALVTMGEAEGETEFGKRLVIDTILNRMDSPHFPNTIHDVVYQPSQFSVMWNGRLDRCYVMPEIVDLVKEELLERTSYDCVFFMAGQYSKYGTPLFQECCHYFSSYD